MSITTRTKRCARCNLDLPREKFTADPRYTSGLMSYCRDCCRAYAREHYGPRVRAIARQAERRRQTPELTRARHLKAMYGLTVEQYGTLLHNQGGCCAICRTNVPGGRGTWHVDHDHDTGTVRGLLCNGCNVGLGLFRDNPERLRAAAEYLILHEDRTAA